MLYQECQSNYMESKQISEIENSNQGNQLALRVKEDKYYQSLKLNQADKSHNTSKTKNASDLS